MTPVPTHHESTGGNETLSKPAGNSLLISFCNQISSPDYSLCIFNRTDKTSQWIDFSDLAEKYRNGFSGVCGITLVEENAVVATQGESPILAIIDISKAEISQCVALTKCIDSHSILYWNGDIYVVSTGTNQIFRISLNENQFGEEELFWSYPGVGDRRDEVHLNGITIDGDELIASCFGPRNSDGSWGSEGRVFYVESGRTIIDGLRQPHSPIVSDDRLLLAESAVFKVHVYRKVVDTCWGREREISLNGYTRGLFLSGDELFVGISASRALSRSQGKLLYAQQKEPKDSFLLAVDLQSGNTNSVWEMLLYGREPYDICAITHQIDLFSETESVRDRIRNMEYWGARNTADLSTMHSQLITYQSAESDLVSVIIPTYNRASYIGDSIRSVLAQTYTNLELIIVDDGSTDDTEAVISGFSDPRLRYIHQPNRGRSNARNHALSLAKGKFITFLDSDELYLPDKVQSQVNYLRSHPGTGMVYTSAHCIDQQGQMLANKYEASVSGFIYENVAFFTPVTITLSTVMTYRAVIDKVGGFDEKMHRFEDTDMWRRISKYCRIDAMQDYTCLLRSHEDNSPINQNPDVVIAALDYYTAKILDEDKDVDIRVRRSGVANLYRYYAYSFISVPEYSAAGRKLLHSADQYDSLPSMRGRYFWTPYTSASIGFLVRVYRKLCRLSVRRKLE